MCCGEQRLGGDTPPVQAGTSQGRVFFNKRSFQPQLCGTQCSCVSAGAGSDNSNVIVITAGAAVLLPLYVYSRLSEA